MEVRTLAWFPESLLVFLAGLCLAGAWYSITGSTGWLLALYATVGMAAWVAWKRIPWPDDVARFASLGAVFLLATVINRLLFAVDYLVAGDRFDAWPVQAVAPEWALVKGEAATLLGTLLTVAIWYIAGGLRVTPAIVFRTAQQAHPLLVILLILAVVTIGLGRANEEAFASLGQLLPVVFLLGLVAVAILPLSYFRRPATQLMVVVLLSLPFIAGALGLGMKENLFVALLPTALVAWHAFRGKTSRFILVTAAALLIGLITTYVSFFRAEVWHANADRSTASVLNDFSRQMSDVGPLVMVTDGAMEFLSRSNASYHRGLAVSIADDERTYPDLVFAPIAYVFIPRVLWAGKPEIKQGWEYSGIVFGQDYIGWSTSSTAAGLYTSLYLGAGWLGALGGALALGLVLAMCTHICTRVGGTFVAGLYSFAMLPTMLRFDESWSVGALSGPPITAAYVLIVFWIARAVSSLFGRGNFPESVERTR
jgi:hypothetical protein